MTRSLVIHNTCSKGDHVKPNTENADVNKGNVRPKCANPEGVEISIHSQHGAKGDRIKLITAGSKVDHVKSNTVDADVYKGNARPKCANSEGVKRSNTLQQGSKGDCIRHNSTRSGFIHHKHKGENNTHRLYRGLKSLNVPGSKD